MPREPTMVSLQRQSHRRDKAPSAEVDSDLPRRDGPRLVGKTLPRAQSSFACRGWRSWRDVTAAAIEDEWRSTLVDDVCGSGEAATKRRTHANAFCLTTDPDLLEERR